MSKPFSWLFTKKYLYRFLILIGVISFVANGYLGYEYQQKEKYIKEISNQCPVGMECKDLRWVSDYVEVINGDVKWRDCGEGQNKCAIWEDYNSTNPPLMKIQQCYQQGTRRVGGQWVTGLPVGMHTILGATIRPCGEVVREGEMEGIDTDNKKDEMDPQPTPTEEAKVE